ncbi:hypothetical protein [Roseisolibacter agri]|uniref:Uncharacterized protein n=1 Tax=Roseisolibacter agri TaxID=2014610 RepID=A0AA37V2Z0_9BACT|nr:hypothetical protein [Roseisolibacter agri]GLC28570.1 hypothetical protein rosag_50830 [Roseisolibacter agri]
MSRLRPVLGLAVGVVLVVSSAMHSLMGWPGLHAALVAADTPSDLIAGLRIGWHFGGAMILTLGLVSLWSFAQRLRGRAVSLQALRAFAAAYALFGAYALVTGDLNPFFLIFVVPGVLLFVAAGEPAVAVRDALPLAA